MARRVRRSCAVLLATALLVAVPGSGHAADPLQPGDYMQSGSAACTLGFVFDGIGAYAGRVYLLTAAHCVRLGGYVQDEAGSTFGRVVVVGNGGSAAHDYAFIEVLSSHVGRVRAAVKGIPGTPKGYTSAAETKTGDNIRLSGYGLGYDLLPATREQRFGVLTYDDASEYALVGLDTFGDSGGPFVHKRTGKAFGIVSRLCLGTCTSAGPTVQGIVSKAWARGFTVRLRTA